MRLPDDEHTGWDRLIAAVMEPDEGAAIDGPEEHTALDAGSDEIVATVDLAAIQARAGSILGTGPEHGTI